jgi:glyoxylase-like metal-dependent hydrolase (beta-lactamase superfamily II)
MAQIIFSRIKSKLLKIACLNSFGNFFGSRNGMKRWMATIVLALVIGWIQGSFAAPARFIKVSDHCYCMQLKEGGENVAAVVTEDGVLIVNPPQEPDFTVAMDALKSLTPKAVRWAVFTEPRYSQGAGAAFFAQHGSILIAGRNLRALSAVAASAESKGSVSAAPISSPWIIFEHQMRLFPSNLEVRVMAVQSKAHTGGDVVVFVPSEKVLFTGGLYEAARYPDIDVSGDGSAIGWMDGMKQVIDSVPVLKTAIPAAKATMPAAKPDPKLEREKTVEEGIVVVSAHGEASNLQNMKDLLDSTKKLRIDISRAIKNGRTCESFLASLVADPYRSYSNFVPFATRLFADLSEAPASGDRK